MDGRNTRQCAAADCNKKFEANTPAAKYCSDRCRWRDHKRKQYKQRAKAGKCPQCGNEMIPTISTHKNKVTPSYCKSCQEYYQERYERNK